MRVKEVKFRPRTDRHDIEHKMKKVVEFLEAGDRVRLIVSFRGRELAHKDLGNKLLFSLLDLCPPSTYVSPIRDEPRSVSVDVTLRKR